MKSSKFRKLTAFLLSAVMTLSMCVVVSTAFAATDDSEEVAAQGVNVTATSNFFPEYTKSFDADTDTVTVTYYINCAKKMLNSQWTLTYDNTILRFNEDKNILSDELGLCITPQAVDSIFNTNVPNRPDTIKGNCTSLNLYSLTSADGGYVPFITVTFDVIGSGDATVNLDLEVMQLSARTSNNKYDSTAEEDVADDSKIFETSVPVYRQTSVYEGTYRDYEEPTTEPTTVAPTTEASTTVAPTEPTTTTPVSDVPTDGYYVYGDNLKLKLGVCGVGKLNGTITLTAGTYTFKLDNYGTLLGYGKTVTDSTNGLTFNAKYSSSCKLIATGGVYTFQVNTATNTLVIKHDSAEVPSAYLVGDINTILKPVDGKPLAVGSTYLEAGTYSFKYVQDGTTYGYKTTVNDSTNGKTLSFNSKYSSQTTIIATGGTYTFTLNTNTHGLIIGFVASKDENPDDVHISGDFDLVLDDNDGESNIATGTTTLEEGTYSFKVYSYGTGYTLGERIVDNGTKNLKSSYKSNVTLIASGGTYTFEFNKTTGALVVTKA